MAGNSEQIKAKLVDNLTKANWEKINYSFPNQNHQNTSIDFNQYDDAGYPKDFTKKEQEILDRALIIFDNKVKEAWKMLRDDYEYHTSDEAIKKIIEANDYKFTEDGKLD